MSGLTQAANCKFGGYSKGMKRKLTIAAGIIHKPPILFLDEPTAGIDVASARQLRQLIADLRQSGTTIFLTTHYIEEAERLCERVAFIVSGKIIRIDTVENLVRLFKSRYVVHLEFTNSIHDIQGKLSSSFPELHFAAKGNGMIRVESDQPIAVGPIIRILEDSGARVLEARRIRPSLEEVFVHITGLETEAMGKEKEKKGGGQ
jgi:ABC-2 type transport system ATP-binding protein